MISNAPTPSSATGQKQHQESWLLKFKKITELLEGLSGELEYRVAAGLCVLLI